MGASESPLESFKSKQTLLFAYLICRSVSRPSSLKACLRFAIFNWNEKLQNIFKKRLQKYGVIEKKSLSADETYLKIKKHAETSYSPNLRAVEQIRFFQL